MSSYLILSATILGAFLLFPLRADAYVDPGTGSYVLQVVIAGIAAGSFALKLLWGRIRALFSGTPAKEQQDQDTNA